MIVGTAGHIDHGKTTLVRALTGVDTDRLPEEKKRGISIELGYAFLDVPDSDQRIGFVDVPGHERLVHTMLAGATGIDFALLLVAADDGVMPQTREHLAVLSLLGMSRGAVVVTKTDRADAQRVQAVCGEATALLAGTPLAGAPVLAVSALGGEGLPALKALLLDAARGAPRAADAAQAFRLAIDRVFTLDGVGTVATGTVHAGTVRVGDTLRLVPGEREIRVRSLHAQNQAVTQSVAGQRCAVALAGVAKDEVSRGQWLVSPAAALATDRIDVALTLWHAETRPLRTGTPVHVHLGAAGVPGTVAMLDGDTLAPGASGRAQLVLRAPIGAWFGDRVVLRDASASRTLAGGTVLDPFAPQRYRRTPQRLAELDALALPEPAARLAACLASAPQGLELRRFAAAQGRQITLDVPGALRHTDAQADWALGAAQTAAAREALLTVLTAYHAKQPDEIGPDAARLRRLAAAAPARPAVARAARRAAPRGRAGAARRLRALARTWRAAVGHRRAHGAEGRAAARAGRLRRRLGARPGTRRERVGGADAHHAGPPGAARRAASGGQGPVLPAGHDGPPGGHRTERGGGRRHAAGQCGVLSRCHGAGAQARHPDPRILRPRRPAAPGGRHAQACAPTRRCSSRR
jgi:selenocysteine-specific elongation factor